MWPMHRLQAGPQGGQRKSSHSGQNIPIYLEFEVHTHGGFAPKKVKAERRV